MSRSPLSPVGRPRATESPHVARSELLTAALAMGELRATRWVRGVLIPVSRRRNPHHPTFTRDVAPIVFSHCAPCHRPGESAPFSLLTYNDVRSRADDRGRHRAAATCRPGSRRRSSGPFTGERGLSDAQIDTIARWVEQGTRRRAIARSFRRRRRRAGWLATGHAGSRRHHAGAFTLAAQRCRMSFALSPSRCRSTRTRYVAGIEFRAGGSRAVHHANIRLDPTAGLSRARRGRSLAGYEGGSARAHAILRAMCSGGRRGSCRRSVTGMAWRLEPGPISSCSCTCRRSGRPEEVRPSVGFFFTDDAPVQLAVALRLGRQNIDIPPGQRYVVRDRYQLPVDVDVYSVHPHAHYRATDVRAFADLPDGTRRPLIHIPDWDFNWQDVYRYETPVLLPRGTTITMEYAYDNSAANIRNPDRPPRRVFGARTRRTKWATCGCRS